jgi:hypothetical protein
MANKVSCRSGRTRLIDPNSFDGQSSSSNVPVQLEDLNISVQLETFKKSRSVLVQDNSNSRVESTKKATITYKTANNAEMINTAVSIVAANYYTDASPNSGSVTTGGLFLKIAIVKQNLNFCNVYHHKQIIKNLTSMLNLQLGW